METVGAIPEGEWSSFNGMCSEEADFMAQLLGNCPLPNEVPSSSNFAFSSTFWPSHELDVNLAGDGIAMYSGETNTNMNSFSQGSSCSGGSSIFFASSGHESHPPCVFVTNSNLMTMDYRVMGGMNNVYRGHLHTNDIMEVGDYLNHDAGHQSTESYEKLPEDVLRGKDIQLRKGHEIPVPEPLKEDKACCPSGISKKRQRITEDFQRTKKSMKSKKGVKVNENHEDDNTNSSLNKQIPSGCCSEDDSNASHELNGTESSSSKGSGALNLNGKTRASRGSATDPQSLYARKRRERINERLKILQNLVPNGTKVDISTMLEEAVHYVKFLQLQIKLLSSDDMWMYAPIAYNGMELSLDLKISTPKSQS